MVLVAIALMEVVNRVVWVILVQEVDVSMLVRIINVKSIVFPQIFGGTVPVMVINVFKKPEAKRVIVLV